MDSPTITMERTQALEKLEQYEQAAIRNPRARTDTDKCIADGYRVLARGGRLVDVNEAIKAGGLNLAGIPKLAIARAHVESTEWQPDTETKWVGQKYFNYAHGGGRFWWGSRNSRVSDDRVRWSLAKDTFDRTKVQVNRFQALVPHIPLPLRPKYKLENYFVLWEANWHSVPTDPYLLRPIAGALMEIIAEWDLTPLEVAAVKVGLATGR